MNALAKLVWENKKRIATLVVAYMLYSLSNIDGYGFMYAITYLVVNVVVFFVAAKALVRTAGSLFAYKGKKIRFFVVEETEEEKTV